jgi:hypothetical protein
MCASFGWRSLLIPERQHRRLTRDHSGKSDTGKGEVLSGTEKWLEAASSGLGAPVPAQVADKLRGKSFRNLDHFREEFWLAVAECPELMSQFKKSNQTAIRGATPLSIYHQNK